MTKRILKIGALVLALCLLAGIGWFANGLLGNPVSRWLARHSAEAYLAEVYPGTDYVIESVRYSFKSGDYNVQVVSPSSMDTRFTLSLSMTGRLWWDSYQTSVTGRWNTWDRLETEYRALADRVFEDPGFPYDSNIAYGSLWMDQEYGEPAPPGLLLSELELDKQYDMQQLGAECGRLCLYVRQEEVTAEQQQAAAEAPAQPERVETRTISPVWLAFQGDETIDIVGLRLSAWGKCQNLTGLDLAIGGEAVNAYGLQLALIRNKVIDRAGALQIAIGANSASELTGMQVGLYNEAVIGKGLQVGLINATNDMRGVQIGLINSTDAIYGYQIGLINVIRSSAVTFFPILNFTLED